MEWYTYLALLIVSGGFAASLVLILMARKRRKSKPTLIESSILVDPKMVGELQHRWNCYHEMLSALQMAEAYLVTNKPDNKILISTLQQAIAKAERKE